MSSESGRGLTTKRSWVQSLNKQMWRTKTKVKRHMYLTFQLKREKLVKIITKVERHI